MRSFFITTLLLLICLEAMAQRPAQELYGLKGPVKSVVNEETEVSQQTGAITRTARGSRGFDREGRLTEEVQFHYLSGEVFRRITHEYAPDGKEHETTFMPDGSVAEKVVFENKRDANGRVIETTVLKGDGSLRNTGVSGYDSQGRHSGGSSFGPDGSLVQRTVVVYDEKNKVTEFTVYNSAGVVIQRDVDTGDIRDFTQDHWDAGSGRTSQSKSGIEEIDSYGNWTRRKIAVKRTVRGKRQELFVEITRTITYY